MPQVTFRLILEIVLAGLLVTYVAGPLARDISRKVTT